ncbi:MAG TPA: glycosyltransferase family 9 protein, partial [Thermodesulfobacteriota bacterium]|nr:glycosyltransferase family 9 protein [Thermodesulfobacteriota bacterium]
MRPRPALPDPGWAAAWAGAARLLAVRLDALGDLLMTGPALRALKGARPGRRLALLTSPAGAAAARLMPEVDEVLVYDAPWVKATAPRVSSAPDRAMVARLARGGFEGAVIFTVYTQSPLPAALLCYLAGIPLRLAHCRENPYQLLTHWLPDPEPQRLVRHEVRRQLDLVAAVGCRTGDERLSIRVPARARRRVGRLLAELGLARERPWAVVHPGASAPSRRYPPEGYAEAARRLVLESGWQVVFTGRGDEEELVERIRAAMGAPSYALVGRLDLGELAALLEQAPVLVANNTGPVHVAAAVGTPVVDLYALTNPQHTPWGVDHRVLSHDVPCRYCYTSVCPEGHHRCLRLVPPGAIVAAARALAAGRQPPA